MNKQFTILACALAAGSMTASGALVAGWEDFSGSTGFAPTQTGLGTTTSVVATTGVGTKNWAQWFNGTKSYSVDTTFGGLSNTVATANANSVSGSNLSLGRADGTLVITLTNNSGVDQDLSGFHFDAVRRFGNSADAWELSFSGAISGSAASGDVTQVNDGFIATTDAVRNKDVDLTTLTDNVWENGTDAIFTLAFTGSANDTASSGGNELLLDNIGVSVVPEPSTALLGLLGTGFFLIRRRRA